MRMSAACFPRQHHVQGGQGGVGPVELPSLGFHSPGGGTAHVPGPAHVPGTASASSYSTSGAAEA